MQCCNQKLLSLVVAQTTATQFLASTTARRGFCLSSPLREGDLEQSVSVYGTKIQWLKLEVSEMWQKEVRILWSDQSLSKEPTFQKDGSFPLCLFFFIVLFLYKKEDKADHNHVSYFVSKHKT